MCCALFAGAGEPARAAELRVPLEMMARLPAYCPHTIGFVDQLSHVYGGTKQSLAEWSAKVGPGYNTLHHHCWGLSDLIKAGQVKLNKDKERFFYKSAVGEFEYVISNVGRDFVLLPEVMTKQAEALARLGEHGKAEANYRQVMELRADYWPAYTGLAQSYVDQKRHANAREVLQQGLSRVSDPRPLERMLKDLPPGK